MNDPTTATPCAFVRDRLEPYVDGELEPAEVQRVRDHLEHAGGCAGCRAELAFARSIRDTLRGLPELACEPRVVERVLAQVAGEAAFRRPHDRTPAPARRAPDEKGGWGEWWRRGLLAAAAVVLVVAGVLGFRSLVPENPMPAAARADAESSDPASAVDAEELTRATEEARWALAYVASIGKRSALTLRDDVVGREIVGPSARALQRAFDPLRSGRGREEER